MANIKTVIKRYVATGKSETECNTLLVEYLKRSGIDAQLTNGRGPDVTGKDFIIEGKWDLLSKVVLDRLVGQLNGYMNRYHHYIFVVIYGDAKYSLLVELVDFCRRQSYTPCVEVIVLRDIVK